MKLKHGALESTIPTEPTILKPRRGGFTSRRLRLSCRCRRRNWLGDIEGEEIRCGNFTRIWIENRQRDLVAKDAVRLGVIGRWRFEGGGDGVGVRERAKGFIEKGLGF